MPTLWSRNLKVFDRKLLRLVSLRSRNAAVLCKTFQLVLKSHKNKKLILIWHLRWVDIGFNIIWRWYEGSTATRKTLRPVQQNREFRKRPSPWATDNPTARPSGLPPPPPSCWTSGRMAIGWLSSGRSFRSRSWSRTHPLCRRRHL